MSSTISKFAEERMKLYEESLANSKAAFTSTNLPERDIKSALKDLNNVEKVQEKETPQTGTIKTHNLALRTEEIRFSPQKKQEEDYTTLIIRKKMTIITINNLFI